MTELSELLDHYFALGVAEGKEGRNHDTADGEAQATRDLIDMKIDRLSRMAERERDGWQPITSAPKEMEPLLLWHEHWLNPVMGRWSDARNGWIEYGSRDIKANIATHWQPLPPSPKPAAVSEGGEDE